MNDGNRDKSITLIKQLAQKDSTIKFIDFSRNFGHQISVTAGLDRAVGKAVVIIDADLQGPPELIAERYSKMKKGYEVVYLKRRRQNGETFKKKVTAKLWWILIINAQVGYFESTARKFQLVY